MPLDSSRCDNKLELLMSDPEKLKVMSRRASYFASERRKTCGGKREEWIDTPSGSVVNYQRISSSG